MDQLAENYKDKNVRSIFIYTHEAHPGEKFPHHTSFDQKMFHAEKFKDFFGMKRELLVDSLDGACHRAYGSMPNMCWILDRGGRPVYKSDWTNTASVRRTLEYLFDMIQERRAMKTPFAPFSVHRTEYRARDETAFMKALERNGEQAVEDFKGYMERAKRRSK